MLPQPHLPGSFLHARLAAGITNSLITKRRQVRILESQTWKKCGGSRAVPHDYEQYWNNSLSSFRSG
jgi:hypothetical protein